VGANKANAAVRLLNQAASHMQQRDHHHFVMSGDQGSDGAKEAGSRVGRLRNGGRVPDGEKGRDFSARVEKLPLLIISTLMFDVVAALENGQVTAAFLALVLVGTGGMERRGEDFLLSHRVSGVVDIIVLCVTLLQQSLGPDPVFISHPLLTSLAVCYRTP
jgi:hypothetical protein